MIWHLAINTMFLQQQAQKQQQQNIYNTAFSIVVRNRALEFLMPCRHGVYVHSRR